jgi:hypothetical protein
MKQLFCSNEIFNPEQTISFFKYAFWFLRLFFAKNRTMQILIRRHGCADWSGSTLFAHAIKGVKSYYLFTGCRIYWNILIYMYLIICDCVLNDQSYIFQVDGKYKPHIFVYNIQGSHCTVHAYSIWQYWRNFPVWRSSGKCVYVWSSQKQVKYFFLIKSSWSLSKHF